MTAPLLIHFEHLPPTGEVRIRVEGSSLSMVARDRAAALRIASYIGQVGPRYGYYTSAERLRSFLEIYSYRGCAGEDAEIDLIAAAYYFYIADPCCRRLRDAFADAVESAS